MDVLQPPDSPRLLYEDPQHWELEAKNKQDFIDHFMSTKYDNLHLYRAADFDHCFTSVENICRYESKWVDNVETQELTNRYMIIDFYIKNPYTRRFKTPEEPVHPEEILLRPRDTWANIAFKAHLSFESIAKMILEF